VGPRQRNADFALAESAGTGPSFEHETFNLPPIARGTTSLCSLACMMDFDANAGTTATRRTMACHRTLASERPFLVNTGSAHGSDVLKTCSCHQCGDFIHFVWPRSFRLPKFLKMSNSMYRSRADCYHVKLPVESRQSKRRVPTQERKKYTRSMGAFDGQTHNSQHNLLDDDYVGFHRRGGRRLSDNSFRYLTCADLCTPVCYPSPSAL
jgi:hypothetical protein